MRSLGLLALLVVATSAVTAQEFSITVSDASGFPGASISSTVSIDNSDPARGFSFGLAYDATLATLTNLDQGAAVLATNGGAGADFFFTDVNPPGGPGGTAGCIISVEAPIEEIPAGTDHEVVICNFDILPTAIPGASSSCVFSNNLDFRV